MAHSGSALAHYPPFSREIGDLTPAIRDIAAALVESIEDAFEREHSPAGAPWADSPTRAFLGRSNDLDAIILDLIERYFLDALSER